MTMHHHGWGAQPSLAGLARHASPAYPPEAYGYGASSRAPIPAFPEPAPAIQWAGGSGAGTGNGGDQSVNEVKKREEIAGNIDLTLKL
jgi:hypothetical protein